MEIIAVATRPTQPNRFTFVSQGELADLIGVDRTTIRAWQRKGLPCERHGSKVLFHTTLAVNWHIGAEILRKRGISVPAQKPLVVALVSPLSRLRDPRFGTEPGDVVYTARRLADALSATPTQLLEALVEAAVLCMRG